MADPANIVVHLMANSKRQRHLTRMQQLRNETAASHMLKVATTLQGGAALNATKGTMPFVFANLARGMSTVATGGTPLAGTTIYTPAPMQPVPKRHRWGRRRGRR
jgi:hypothetical protein